LPRPHLGGEDRAFAPTAFDPAAVAALAERLRDGARRRQLLATEDVALRAWNLVIEEMIYPTRFDPAGGAPAPFGACERRPCLDLPLAADYAEGVVFADDVGLRSA
jgi:hypothetical protein